MESFQEAIDRDLAKCSDNKGYRPMWVIAADSNKREKVVKVRRPKEVITFIGC